MSYRDTPPHEDSASAHGRLSPWSDDQTTATYQATHLQMLQQHAHATGRPFDAGGRWAPLREAGELDWQDTNSGWDAAPDIIEISPARGVSRQTRRNPTERLVRNKAGMARQAGRGSASEDSGAFGADPTSPDALSPESSWPSPASARIPESIGEFTPPPSPEVVREAQPRSAGRPSAATTGTRLRQPLNVHEMVLPAPPLHIHEDEEENPFARPTTMAWVWVHAFAGLLGLFGAVLFGRVLLGASTVHGVGSPELPAAVTQPAPAEPAPAKPAAVEAVDPPAVEAVDPPAVEAAPSSTTATTEPTQAQPAIAPPSADADARSARTQHAPAKRSHAAHATKAARSHAARRGSITSQRAADRDLNAALPMHSAPEKQAAPSRASSSEKAHSSGTLRINSRPWSQVFIDGRLIGNTPQREISLSAGPHKVKLVNPQFAMGKTFTLNVAAGETITRVETLEE